MGSSQTDVQVKVAPPVLPTVGRIVHYVASDLVIVLADGTREPDVRAMLITGVFEGPDNEVRVCGQVFRQSIQDRNFIQPQTEVLAEQDETDHKPGTWHWPKRK